MRRRRGSSTASANVIESNVPITSADHLYSFFPRIFFGSGGKEISDEVSKKVKHYYYSKGYSIGAQYKRAREMASDKIVPRVCMLEETNPFDLFSRISVSTTISSQSYSHVLSYPDSQMGIPNLLKSDRAYANHYENLREKRLTSKRSSQNGYDKTKSKGKDGIDTDENGESQILGPEKERKKRVRYEDEDEEEMEKKDKQKRKSVKMEKAELEQSLKEEEDERLKGGDRNDSRGNDEDEEEISFRKLSSKKAKKNKMADDDAGAGDGNESGSEDGGNDDDEIDNEEDDVDDIINIPKKTRLDRSQSIGTEGDDYENAYNQSDEEDLIHEDENYDDDGGNDDD